MRRALLANYFVDIFRQKSGRNYEIKGIIEGSIFQIPAHSVNLENLIIP
jgi:hypothetical protein